MDRMACVNLPEFPLQLLLRRHPEWSSCPVAVVDRDKAQGVILWANDLARKHRILPGMRYAAGLSLAGELRAGVVPEPEIHKNIEALTGRLRFFTVDVEPSRGEPGVFWLSASGLSLLYPSLQKWANLIRTDLVQAGFRASLAVGFSRFGTYAVAKTHKGAVVFKSPSQERAHAARVPIERLGFDPKGRDLLARLGITTVGGFLKLPANDIRKRFGEEVERIYRLATGNGFSPLQPEAPEEPVAKAVDLDHPETNLDRLMVHVEQQLHALLEILTERGEALAAVGIDFVFDNRDTKSERLQPASPTLNLPQITELIRLRLESAALSAGVTEIAIEVESVPVSVKQEELFADKPKRDFAATDRAFARLRAEFGEDAVLKACLRDGHLPEARFEWEPMTAISAPKPRNVQVPPLVRRIFVKPILLSAGHRTPDTQLMSFLDDGSAQEALGPFVISGGWWVREVQREYYFIRTSGGRSLWMYYDRRRKHWYLHGEVE